eukprot:gnl/TRDRNA2_/TRDRNA2_201152_c0_seq1.p1 gnl/TRDRNA2_/TRDRNA2_201152_c0~~gnl/TRDRNA2_/TRDRNA2_201152_c0_seq1.p1  ORF type:complete len:448 (+),score=62.26 gnl/TRDRNA2_/TRDRNA2_201152_c0_seq1:141-1484(+)
MNMEPRTRTSGAQPTPGHVVQVVSNSWARDSHDLFDYEAHQLHTKTFQVTKSTKCIRAGTDVQMVAEPMQPPLGSDILIRILQKDSSFVVDKASPSSSSKKLWLVVRDLPTCGHVLSENDIIKLGRFKFRARQMVATSAGSQQPELKLDDTGAVCKVDPDVDLSRCPCRICLLEGPSEEGDDPLIAPCMCKGSIEYVHLGCLRHWIKGRLNFSDASSGSYFYRPLSCELCKSSYPAYVHHANERFPLVEVPWTAPPFIVLENMVRDPQAHASRGLHVISLAENKLLKLGRGHESDVRIADVSISRCHATIRFHRGNFVLEDNHSKFGTLLAMKKPRTLEPDSTISIQVGRTVLSLSLQPHPELGAGASSSPLLPLMQGSSSSSASDERALRLSLLTRGSIEDAPEDGDRLLGGGTGAGQGGSNTTGGDRWRAASMSPDSDRQLETGI